MPSKHNEKSEALNKKSKESFKEKELKFIEQCQRRLEERLAIFDSKVFGVEPLQKHLSVEEHSEALNQSEKKKELIDAKIEDPIPSKEVVLKSKVGINAFGAVDDDFEEDFDDDDILNLH